MSEEFKSEVNKHLDDMFEEGIEKIIVIGINQTTVYTKLIRFEQATDALGAIEVAKYKILTNRMSKE